MARKSATAAAHGAPALALLPSTAPTAPASAPATVADRKRARRAPKAPAAPPPVVKPEIDLTRPDARKALAVAFPKVTAGKVVEAGPTEEAAAFAYIEARDAEARAKGAKEAAGNVLCYAIADAEEIHGNGWKATWKYQKSEIDWGKLVKDLKIESEVIELYRKPSARVMRVTETVEK